MCTCCLLRLESLIFLVFFAFALGFLSHLLSDAWTTAGIRPLLPIASFRFWIVPKFLRGRSSGPLDFLARFLAMCGILAGVIAYALVHA